MATYHTYDALTTAKLAEINEYVMLQTLQWDDVAGCAYFPNLYSFHDRNKMIPIPGTNKFVGTPVFIIEEESSCCCRMLCETCQPMSLKLYHADPNVQVGELGKTCGTSCCGTYPKGHKYSKSTEDPEVIATFDRPGCGAKLLGSAFPSFCACCQDELFMFPGNKMGAPGKLSKEGGVIATSIQPICGGGCTPTLELSEGEKSSEKLSTPPYAWVEGPTFFGGMKDLCCATPFTLSSEKGKSGDIGTFKKQAPDNAMEMICAFCSDADGYEVTINPEANMSETQKLSFFGTLVQLDYMFFEKDNEICVLNKDASKLIVTLCNWYCCGMMSPVNVAIPLR